MGRSTILRNLLLPSSIRWRALSWKESSRRRKVRKQTVTPSAVNVRAPIQIVKLSVPPVEEPIASTIRGSNGRFPIWIGCSYIYGHLELPSAFLLAPPWWPLSTIEALHLIELGKRRFSQYSRSPHSQEHLRTVYLLPFPMEVIITVGTKNRRRSCLSKVIPSISGHMNIECHHIGLKCSKHLFTWRGAPHIQPLPSEDRPRKIFVRRSRMTFESSTMNTYIAFAYRMRATAGRERLFLMTYS